MDHIICAGHVNWDVTMQVDALPEADGEAVVTDQWQAGGGSASNTAVVLASLDYETVLLGSVGEDRYATLALQELDEAGVDCSHVRQVAGNETTVKYLVVDQTGRVMVLANEGANEQFTADDLSEEMVSTATHLHLTSQQPKTAYELAERAQNAGLSVSLDPGRRLADRNFSDVLTQTDVVFFNDREEAAARENGMVPSDDRDCLTVVKQGDGGARLTNGSETITHDGFDVEAVDTAGAGDAFAAGFLAARLDGTSDERALAIGNACGAIAVQSPGARATISWKQIREYCDREFAVG